METTLNVGGKPSTDMASTPSQSPKPSIYYAPNILTPSEEDWLRQHMKDTAETMRRLYREVDKAAWS